MGTKAAVHDDEVAPILVAGYLWDMPSLRPPTSSDHCNVCLSAGRRGGAS